MNQPSRYRQQQGFTLVELSLSMAFIALLLLGIAMLTMQISAIYSKGLTIRAVNESGQLISSDMQRTLNVSRPLQVAHADDGSGGRLCANSIVYVWNYAGSLTNGFGGYNRFDDGVTREVRLLRFIGDDSYCKVLGPGNNYKLLPAASMNTNVTELLKSGDNNLALSQLTFTEHPVKDDDTQRLYQITFLIGSDSKKFINKSGCEVPDSKEDDQYCAVNEFSFTARAGNKGVSNVFGN